MGSTNPALKTIRRTMLGVAVLALVICLDRQVMTRSTQDSSLDYSLDFNQADENQSLFAEELEVALDRNTEGTHHTQDNELSGDTAEQAASTNKTDSKPVNPVATEYLKKFGYMNTTKNNEKNIGPDMLTKAMIKFQESMGLNQTGVVGEEDLKMMALPRCGNMEGYAEGHVFRNSSDESNDERKPIEKLSS